ncbi:SHOCT domain-containing protein [Glutamicibacter nicotianae]|uniref:SHOCT domain-containing protein n=1 Tax=Glutamicibacter nicotianae TaxID=37929 RepID=UPI0025567D52|nr:SHOCT domain-containing protein [Glutamicibacter nicotianae]WIV44911.1 SHOCT domain-containing protein [Glutamicibacter nicotianae]
MGEIEYSEEISGLAPEDLAELGYVDLDPGTSSSLFDTVDTMFSFGLPLFSVLFIAFAGLIIFVIVRNFRKAKSAGFDPLTMETDLMARAANSALLAPKKSIEDKLSELDSLHSRGVITRDEYLQARRDALGG